MAEEITSRFLNVISLFNGTIPLVAVQMRALQLGNTVSLVFTTVLDQVKLGLVDDDEEVHEVTDRGYWENRGSKNTVAIADEVLEILQTLDPALELKFNKFYVGLARAGQPDNFVVLRPKKKDLRVEARVDKDASIEQQLDAAGLDLMDYDERSGRYRVRLGKGDVKKHAEVLTELLTTAHLKAIGGARA